jgi:hypothetical protein
MQKKYLHYQCEICCNQSTTDYTYILQSPNTLEKKEHNAAMHQLFIDFKQAYDSFRREMLYIIIAFGIPTKQVGIKRHLN